MLREGNSAEALRELSSIQNVAEVELAVMAAMLSAHESAKVVDHDAVVELSARLEVEERTAADASALPLAAFHWSMQHRERARAITERVLRLQPRNSQAAALLGWILVAQQLHDDPLLKDESELEEAAAHFEGVLEQEPGNLLALMGRAKVAELKRDTAAALDALTEAAVTAPGFAPAQLEKARLLLAAGDWEQMSEAAGRVLRSDSGSIAAVAMTALHMLLREGNLRTAAQKLQELSAAIQQREPRNADLYHRMASVFGKLSCQDGTILNVTLNMAERAAQLQPDSCHYMSELGQQLLLLDRPAAAADKFATAVSLDELSLEANMGAVECQILGGELEEAAGQLQFLEEMSATSAEATAGGGGKDGAQSAELLYLNGLLLWKQGRVPEATAILERCLQRHFEAAGELLPSMEQFQALHPSRIMGIVRLMLTAVGGDPRGPTEAPSAILAKCIRALEMLSRQCPAHPSVQLLYARALYLNNSLDAAQRKAADMLRCNPEDHAAHLLVCSVYVHQGRPQEALSALQLAVSANFALRESTLYHIVTAQVHIANQELEAAKKVLETALSMPGVRTPLTEAQRQKLARRVAEPSLHERASIYLLLVSVLTQLSKDGRAPPEARKLVEDAVREFSGTSEEVRVTVAECELSIAAGDVEGALARLRGVPPASPHYGRARTAMADIFLRHRRDRVAYIKCYMDLLEKTPDFDTHCSLGEAFLRIQEPEKAVRAFESALELNPKHSELCLKVAQALVAAHDYGRAVDYFNRAIRNDPAKLGLQLELAQLLVRLRQWEQAKQLLNKRLQTSGGAGGSRTIERLSLDVETWLLLARAHQGCADAEQYAAAQQKALELQTALLSKLRGELPEAVALQRRKAAAICYDLADFNKRLRRTEQAAAMYREALAHDPGHEASLLALARAHLSAGDLEACQQQCVQLLKAHPDNEEASVMLAELMSQQEQHASAIFYFEQLLDKHPGNAGALSQLILLLRRAGRPGEIDKYLEAAAKAAPNPAMDAGLHYCKGLHARLKNDPREALRCFQTARKDSRWSSLAVLHMVEVYLNPDNDAIWQEQDTSGAADQAVDQGAVNTARMLLQQVRPADTQSDRYRVLEAYALMASKSKPDVEAALSKLLDLANADPSSVPVLLALATGFMMLKQTSKARNQLKRIQKIPYRADEAEEFERSWLLLADIHTQGGKYDLAQELCQRCLKYNKSCAKAWEHLGAIMEREQSYKDAADYYEKAWKYENEASAQVGFKLAFNYLKAKRFVEAVDVCHRVIKAFPEYPKIRKDILDKARAGLRP